MPRIIAGTHGGRTIPSPPTSRTRPTSDRVREAVFSKLDAWGVVSGARVLDLYAGTGSLGLEALSRGARHVTALEAHRATAQAITGASRELGFADRIEVQARSVHPGMSVPASSFTLVFADPPYPVASEELVAVLLEFAVNGAFKDEATLVIERSSRSEALSLGPDFVDEGTRDFGDTRIEYFTYLDPAISAARSAASQEAGGSDAAH